MPILAWFCIAGAIAFVVYAVYHTRKEKEKEQKKKVFESALNITSKYTKERLELETHGEMLQVIEDMGVSEEHKEELRKIVVDNELDDNIIAVTLGSMQNQNLYIQTANIKYCALKHLIVFTAEEIQKIYSQLFIVDASPFINDVYYFLGLIEPYMDKGDYKELFHDVSEAVNLED